jgi:lysophospholipase L1-like esterase
MRTHQSDGTYHLIDLYLHFAAEDGLMSPLLTYDGTHLNEEGYALWVSIVKPYITQK